MEYGAVGQWVVVLGLAGGAVVKKHLKQDDAVKALKTRAITNIKKPEDLEVDGQVEFPAEFKAFLLQTKKQGQDIEFLKASGTMVVQTGLRHVSDDGLKMLCDIMDLKAGRRGTSEDRVIKAIRTMFPTMNMLDCAKDEITRVQHELISKFVGIYAEEHHSYSNGSASFDNASFLKQVETEQTRRQALSEQAQAAQQPQAQLAIQNQACTVS